MSFLVAQIRRLRISLHVLLPPTLESFARSRVLTVAIQYVYLLGELIGFQLVHC